MTADPFDPVEGWVCSTYRPRFIYECSSKQELSFGSGRKARPCVSCFG